MKAIFLSGVAAIGIAASAYAADLPMRTAPFAPTPAAPSWTDFYLGGNIGYLVQHDSSSLTNFTDFSVSPPTTNPQSGTASATSFTGGIQAGFNWQFASSWVVGLEGDWNWADPSDNLCRGTNGGLECSDNGTGFLSMSEKTDWLATARGRLGFLWNSVLIYGTGGAAWGSVKTTLTANCSATAFGCGASLVPSATSSSFTNTKMGWVAGLGAETMLGPHWSTRLEWLHYDLGSVNDAFTSAAAVGPYSVSWSRTIQYDIVRLGANYQF
jgi:outer membrane immunogenic protein